MAEFDITLADAQGTHVQPLNPTAFDLEAYGAHEAELLERCYAFWRAPSGVLVHRRFRVPEVFGAGCADMARSLALQLGALRLSMDFPSDIPNYLEPWYGIGTIASAFGAEYLWKDAQAPAMLPVFHSVEEALACDPTPVERTAIGRRTLAMIEYFLEQTDGRMPLSLCDTQSPLDITSMLLPTSQFMLEVLINPAGLRELLMRAADLMVDFTRKQAELIGPALVWPGHGFASSRVFAGLGMSDDQMIMLSPDQYQQVAIAPMIRAGAPFGGPAFHSCGNWSVKAEMVRAIDGLRMADGAFTAQTDPDPNSPERIAEVFTGTGIVVNARMVGDARTVAETMRRLWRPGLKLIAVTYCATPQEQTEAYERIHEICG